MHQVEKALSDDQTPRVRIGVTEEATLGCRRLDHRRVRKALDESFHGTIFGGGGSRYST